MARIAYVSRTLGGHDRAWLERLRSGGHEVTAFVRDGVTEDVADDVRGWTGPVDLGTAAQEHRSDLFVAGPLTDAATAAVLADGPPVVGLSWAFDLLVEADDPVVTERLGATLPRLAALHLDSAALRDRAVALGADPDRITVAPWGIDTGFFTPGPAPEGLAEPGTRLVLSTRSWEPMYDVPTVVRGFARAHAADPGLRLILAGGGSDDERVRAAIEQTGVAAVVRTVGRLDGDQVRDWLRVAHCYVSAAHSDGASLSLLEALAVGTPVVVTDLPTNREWVTDDVTFPIGDDAQLADRILAPRTYARDDRERARERVGRDGDRERVRRIVLDVIDRVLSHSAAR